MFVKTTKKCLSAQEEITGKVQQEYSCVPVHFKCKMYFIMDFKITTFYININFSKCSAEGCVLPKENNL